MNFIEKNFEEFSKTNTVKNKVLLRYNDSDDIISLPKEIEELGENAFRNNFCIKSIFMPSTITKVGEGIIEESFIEANPDEFVGCFSRCINLLQARLSTNLDKIPACMFANCINLKEISIPNKVEQISRMAFYGCTDLKKIDLPKSLKIIDMYAFYNCFSLKKIFIPKSVKYIGKYAFSGFSENQTLYFECSQKETLSFHQGWNSGAECKIVYDFKKEN